MGNTHCRENPSDPGEFTTGSLKGYVKRAYKNQNGETLKFYIGGNNGKWSYEEYLKNVPEYDRGAFDLWPKTCKIMNARLKQDSYESPAAFFKEHGFCLLKSETKVKEWNDDYDIKVNDITEIYNPEVEALLRNEVFPSKEFGEIINMHMLNIVLRRGRDTKRTGYIPVVH